MSVAERIFVLRSITLGSGLGSLAVVLWLGITAATVSFVIMLVSAIIFAATFVIPHGDKD